MTIQQYFEQMYQELGFDAADAIEAKVFEMSVADDSTEWDEWVAAHPEIDFQAVADCGETYLMLWGWDLCGE